MASIEVENTVHDSVEAMLSPENLSELLGRPVTDADRGDAAVWGNAGSQFTPVDTGVGTRLEPRTCATDDPSLAVVRDRGWALRSPLPPERVVRRSKFRPKPTS